MFRNLITVAIALVMLIMLIGLLLPAVQRVREAAARSKCQGHLCQLACTLHDYAATNSERLPMGTVFVDSLPPEQRLSWYVWFLYRLESDVFKQLDLKAGAVDERNQIVIDQRIEHFICPSSGECIRQDGYIRSWKSPQPVTHYVGIAGIGADAPMLPLGHPRAGAFGFDRQTSIRDGFTDGTSNTIMLMETSMNPGHWAFGGPPTVRGIELNRQYIGPGKQFGGFHPDRTWRLGETFHLVQVAMVDGSVKRIRSTIAPEVFEALATAGGREPLPTDW